MSRVRFWALAKLNTFVALTHFLTLRTVRLTTLLFVCLAFLGWASPVLAANRISPRVEQQVLQIIRDHPEVIIETVQVYQQQQQQKLQAAQQAFLQGLKTNPQQVLGTAPTTGAPEAKFVLLEFSDFQCPYCAEAHKTLKKLVADHQGEVKLAFKHYPLPTHAQALPSAKAAWAAGQQGKFWEYHDALFAKQDKLGEELYLETAKNLNLNLEKFNQERYGDAANVAIGQDIQLAQTLGINGTPFFVIAGGDFTGAVQLADIEGILAKASKS